MTIGDFERSFACRTPGVMDAAQHYAVLVPLIDWAGEVYLLFETRAQGLRRQPGEVCFPGGRMEPGETPVDCALRETWEELGIPAAAIRPIAPLDTLFHQSGFLLHPILAQVAAGSAMNLTVNLEEVANAFLVPVAFFRQNPPKIYAYALEPKADADFPYASIGIPRGYDWKAGRVEVPIYHYKDHPIWGITGRIVRHLMDNLE